MKRSLLLLVFLAGGLLARGGWTAARGTTIGCVPSATRLCLAGNRFAVEAAWTVPGLGSGAGQAVPLTGDTGIQRSDTNPSALHAGSRGARSGNCARSLSRWRIWAPVTL